MTATPSELAARVRALNGVDRRAILYYLAGLAPEALEKALDEIDRQQAEVTP